ncbi:predicted protein [Plenodomus lingam JN3]|uniref:Predicted protein n=1 Tax=Leptosphaeria maculans (strain JN3 / isolate v23.1.3 / race Av1-4-5-6-7-8) TaxID=985895 RepID=E5A188_LEPMJ|nr:predicted protein [Plenodomus lingam JN3]CBX97352.1 predicted protein [Plenodomus lingam JN3]
MDLLQDVLLGQAQKMFITGGIQYFNLNNDGGAKSCQVAKRLQLGE